METTGLKSIWDAYDKKLDKSLKLNRAILESLQTDKAKSKLNALLAVKLAGIFFGILWILFLGALVYTDWFKHFYFCVSLLAMVLFSTLAIVIYAKHIRWINRINYNEGVIQVQQQLARLQLSTIQITRVLWLQLPFYTTFYWNQSWINNSPQTFWLLAFPSALACTIMSVWLYKNIVPINLNKKWLRHLLVAGTEYKYLLAASELLREIDAFN